MAHPSSESLSIEERLKTQSSVGGAVASQIDFLSAILGSADSEDLHLSDRKQEICIDLCLPNIFEHRQDWPQVLLSQASQQLQAEVWLFEFTHRGRSVRSYHDRTSNATQACERDLLPAARDVLCGGQYLTYGLADDPSPLPSAIFDHTCRTLHVTSAFAWSWKLEELGRTLVGIAFWPSETPSSSTIERLKGCGPKIAQGYETWALCHFGEAQWKKRRKWLDPSRTKMAIGAFGLISFVGGLFYPIPYRPKREGLLEAAARHYVSSPMEGKLIHAFVRPGEEVEKGQVLAQLEDMQLKRDISSAEAELETASKKRDIALATSAWGDLRLAQLECTQASLKIDSLKEKLSSLEIQSPIDGMVVQGDWYTNEGMPVTFGQSLFEIAPLDTMVCEIRLKPEDLPWITVGTEAVLRAESTGIASWYGRIARIEPHAEIVDDEAVFLAEMEIENSHRLFRPGMKVETVVDTGNHSIAWILFQKPFRWLCNQWIW